MMVFSVTLCHSGLLQGQGIENEFVNLEVNLEVGGEE